ncbi:hypothetical protein ISS05_05420 [Candidatus Woesearchaeota archaeon]|nr:hypothetical protein [Candidatus Woesearchaeota archaeon]
MDKNFKVNYLYSIALFLSLLIITIPFYVSDVIAVIDKNSDYQNNDQELILKKKTEMIILFATEDSEVLNISQLEAGEACIEKNKKTGGIIDLLDNDIIKTLEKIASLMQAISSVWTAVKAIMSTAALILYGTKFGAPLAKKIETVRDSVDKFMHPINFIVGCGWAKWCKAPIPGLDISVDPYENIYVAIACLCPTAVLVNLRKLRTIYQTYNCCIEQACTNGISTTVCENELDEQTCMFFGKGAIASFFMKAIIGLVMGFIAQYVVKWLMKQKIPHQGSIFALANLPFEIINLQNAIKDLGTSFADPNCGDLGFDKLKDEAEDDWMYSQEAQVQWIDTDGDGVLDALINVETGDIFYSK